MKNNEGILFSNSTHDMSGRFNNPDSVEKIVSRHHVLGFVDAILSRMPDISALTLPASNFVFERLLKHQSSVRKQTSSIRCVEEDENVYIKGVRDMPVNTLDGYFHKDVFEYILHTKNKFNLIWLDLCSCLSNELVAELENVVDSKCIADQCLFSVTIQKAREKSLDIGCKTLKEFRLEVFPRKLQKAAESVSRDCKLLEVYNYKSTNKLSTPMSIYTFLITSQTKENVKENSEILHSRRECSHNEE